MRFGISLPERSTRAEGSSYSARAGSGANADSAVDLTPTADLPRKASASTSGCVDDDSIMIDRAVIRVASDEPSRSRPCGQSIVKTKAGCLSRQPDEAGLSSDQPEAQNPGNDQKDRHDEIEEARHDQNEYAREE
jgi:hypothetical protein